MNYAIIENDIVTNVAVSDSPLEANWIQSDTAGIGYTFVNGEFVAPTPTLPTLADYDAALTGHLDAVAQTHRYDNRINCALRAGYPGPYQTEGIAFASWMDDCNVIGYQMLEDFQAGLIHQPTIDDMLSALPDMLWP